MAGMFTRLQYDRDTTNDSVKTSTGKYRHIMDANRYEHRMACPAKDEYMIDVDSILKGIDRKKSNSRVGQSHTPINIKFHKTPLLENREAVHNSRYSHPAYEIKGLAPGDMRLDYPHNDPQCNIFQDMAVNTRLQARDNFKMVCQEPISQDVFMPRQQAPSRKKCQIMTCDDFGLML